MQMKPYKSFLFIIVTLAILLALPLFFPNGKINISEFELRVYCLNFLKIENQGTGPVMAQIFEAPATEGEEKQKDLTEAKLDVQNNKKPGQAPISSLQESQELLLPGYATSGFMLPCPDELRCWAVPGLAGKEGKQAGQNTRQDKTPGFAHSDIIVPEGSEGSWAGLSLLFERAGLSEKPLRVLYYGDSQIENDRITSVFRQMLQERYGGAGRGLIPVEDIYNSANNFVMSSSGNWQTRSVIKTRKKQLDLGLLCEASCMKNYGGNVETSSWIKVKSIKKDLKSGYSVLSLFYRSNGNSDVKVSVNGVEKVKKQLYSSNIIKEIRFNLGTTPEMVELSFTTDEEVTLYGLNLESPSGIMVDNIALRGRSYPEFSRIDTTRLKQMAELLNPALIVMQYGVNVVPNIRADYSYYKGHLTRELAYLREVLPEVPVLLVSVSDMAYKSDGALQSYPNIENVLKSQKEAAIENNCAFWNLYETMGGDGSMIDWVERTPPLGNKDYVHYTALGAEKVGSLFAGQFIKALDLRQTTALLANEP